MVALQAQLVEVLLDRPCRRCVLLDEDGARGAARERLEPHRAGARVEVEHAAPSSGPTRLKTFSRTRSDVGLVSSPRGAWIVCPRCVPGDDPHERIVAWRAFSLVHGAWHGGWAWDLLRAELEARGHVVASPDLPCDDVAAGAVEYARLVPPAEVVVGHSLGGLTIPLVAARLRVFLCALVPGVDRRDAYVPGFGAARTRDELGRSYYPDPAGAARELQYPPGALALAQKLRPQAPVDSTVPHVGPALYIVCARDAAVRPEWQRDGRPCARRRSGRARRRSLADARRTRASSPTSSSQLPARQASCDDAATARRSRDRPRSSRTHSVPARATA